MSGRRARSGVLAIVLWLGLPTQLAIAGHEETFVDTEAPAAQPFIFNGEPVENPGWVVSITRNGSYICTGALLNQQWVLTAAHCVDDLDGTFWVNVGDDSWFLGIQRGIASVHIHPDYQPTLNESVDLAMLRLDAPVTGTSLPVLAASSWPRVDQPLLVMGWGETFTGSAPPDFLQGAGVWVGSDSTGAITSPNCPPEWVAASGFEDFCFGGSSWACRGDSGGPLVGYASPQHSSGPVNTIYGVTSYGDAAGCTEATSDTVAQSVGPHLAWIRGFLGAAGSPDGNDEMFFYRNDGLYRYYNIRPNGTLPSPILGGNEYTTGWDAITAIDLDGDGQDEMFFYRDDGLYRYYNIRPNGTLGTPILAGDTYTPGWDAITAVDLDGDGQDEMFFYRDDGLYRYYNIRPNGTLGTPILAGDTYTPGWDAITAVDLDGDGQDEMFFYRDDGLYRYYNIRPNGTLGTPILAGDTYTPGWDAITAVDLDGDGQDEMFFYRDDGLYRYYNIRPNGTLGTPILAGDTYTQGWTSITAVDLDG